MSDIKIDYNDPNALHDLDITGHRLNLATGEEAIEQQIRIRLQFFLGEWKLNTLEGIPYFRNILIKAPNEELVKQIFREAIETTPGITKVTEMTYDLDPATRILELSFRATMDTGEELVFSPFTIEI